jgi:hypothetical protein
MVQRAIGGHKEERDVKKRGNKLRRKDDRNIEETGGCICQPLCTGEHCSQEVRHRNTPLRKVRNIKEIQL